MPKKSKVWSYFTRLDGEDSYKATCNKCADGKKFDISGGTTNLWKHLVKDFTHIVQDDQGDEQETVLQCDICKRKLDASVPGKTKKLKATADTSSLAEHVMTCIKRKKATAAGASRPPPVQMRAPPGSGSPFMDIDPAEASRPLLMQTRAPTGPGSSSMDLLSADLFIEENLPADLGTQLPPPPSAPSCPAGSSSDGEAGLDEPSKCLTRMIALGGHDPSIVDDVYFRNLLLSLKPEFTMPSRVKIEEECDRICDKAKSDLLSRQSSSHGGVSLAVGRTKAVDKEFVYVTWNFIDDGWMLRKLVVDALIMVVDDEDVYDNASVLGIEVTEHDPNMLTVLNHIPDHDTSNRLSMLTSETNDRDFCISLKDYIQNRHLKSNNTRTREIFCTTYVDMVLHAIANCFFLEFYGWHGNEMFEHVEELQLTRENRQQLISHLGLDDPLMYHDKKWYTRYCCLKLLRMESSIATDTSSIGELLSKVCGRKHHNMDYCMDSTSDFLCKVWEKIHHAIQRISASSYPTAHLCFEILLNMRKFFKSELAHMGKVAVSLCEAIKTLEEAIKDSYLVWSIPLALDPRYKLRHIRSIFEEAFESEDAIKYISEVEKNMIELYADYRKDEVGTSTGVGHSESGVAVAVSGADGDDPVHQRDWPAEWKRYFSDPAPPAKDFNILRWWKLNSQKYPTLAQMASDALSMPTCSKPSHDEIAQIRSIVRGYSQKRFMPFCQGRLLSHASEATAGAHS
ncbi:hypothetical protein QOZ80_8BG0643430 [Eleusine coracana subsp. coracana]|nr:hypothetical protein QOZ80_8BG0643430 [Eleusine coracana subsp. coracana]